MDRLPLFAFWIAVVSAAALFFWAGVEFERGRSPSVATFYTVAPVQDKPSVEVIP